MHHVSRLLSFAVVLLCSAVPAGAQTAAKAAVPELQGHLRTIDGIEFLFLRGTLEERGFAEGYLVGDRMVEVFRDFVLSKRFLPQPRLWDIVVLPRLRKIVEMPAWVRVRAAAILRGLEARDPKLLQLPELRRDLTVDDLLGAAMLPDLVGLRCSSFVAWGDRTKGKGPIVGRNLDYFSTAKLLVSSMVIVHAPRGERAGWVSVGWPGILGCLTGVSDRGVSVALHDVSARAEPRETVTSRMIALQELVERVGTGGPPREEAAAILREFRYAMGGNVMVGWNAEVDGATRVGGAVFELHPELDKPDGVTVRGPADGQSFIACSNHHRERVAPSECWRYEALFDGVGDARALDFDRGWKMIGRSEVAGTLHQCVIDLETLTLGVRVRRNAAEEWDEVRGLDVNALLEEAAGLQVSAEKPGTQSGRDGR